LSLKLHIIKRDDLEDYSKRHRFCFAVIDLNKSASYPLNYLCMFPAHIGVGGNRSNYEKIFGEKSLEQAEVLLNNALNEVEDFEIKVELERRLKLLEPKNNGQIKCCNCGKVFLPRRKRKFKNNFCEDCLKKKFGSRQ
jgi:hypothetical protein